MNRLDRYEWLLIILMVATLIVGIFVAVERHDDNVAMNPTITQDSPLGI